MKDFLVAVAAALRVTGHPVAAEVARGLAEVDGAAYARGAGPDLPILAHLAPALGAADAHPLAAALRPFARALPWTRNENADKSSELLNGQTYVELVGPDGVLAHAGLRVGLYLQAPGIHYPPHSHAAVELYLVLAGDPLWWQAGRPTFAPGAGALIHHESRQSHAMTTRTRPLLALWTWTGDIRFETYRMDQA